MAKASRKRPYARTRKSRGRRGCLWIPLIVLAMMLGWLYRYEIANLVGFEFGASDFSRRSEEKSRIGRSGNGITEEERKELEKLLRNQ